MKLTAEQLKQIYTSQRLDVINKFLPFINNLCEQYAINTPLRLAHFLAQIGHESAQLTYVKEIASGKAYDTGTLAKNLGNTLAADGDGQKYKGRGLIQITGTSNYKALSQYLKIDLLNNPELLEQPHYAVESAIWYWNTRKLNDYADKDDVKTITKKINGGFNGLEDRVNLLNRAKKVLKC